MTQPVRKYTATFVLQHLNKEMTSTRVLLVSKTHPEWQEGLLNAVGGGVEDNESAIVGAIRELLEETGWKVPASRMDNFCIETGPGYQVFFVRTWLPLDLDTRKIDWAKTDKGEELHWHDARNVREPMVGNLHWLLPLAMDPRAFTCTLSTVSNITEIKTW